MPTIALFKSKPKSDRRLQWKTLKAKHAKALSAKKIKVEIGLGKALDKYQKDIEALVKLDASKVNRPAFKSVVTSGAAVRRLATKLEPKVKGMPTFTKFLTDLKKDTAWWVNTSKEVGQTGGYVSSGDFERLTEAMHGLNQLKAPVSHLDANLAKALKKTKSYTPPSDVVTWNNLSRALGPGLAKYELLHKKPKENYKLLVGVMRSLEPTVSDMRTKALHMTSIASDNHPAVVDWKAVEGAAKTVLDKAFEAGHAIRRLR